MMGTKMSVEWHEECLATQKESLATARIRLRVAATVVRGLKKSVRLAESQIAEAKRRGMTAFDADRLLVKRKKGTTYATL